MYTVYILRSEKFDKIYVGYTSNLEARILSHNELGKTGWTVKYRPWQLVYTEEYQTKEGAMMRERELKGGQGRAWIRSEIIKKS